MRRPQRLRVASPSISGAAFGCDRHGRPGRRRRWSSGLRAAFSGLEADRDAQPAARRVVEREFGTMAFGHAANDREAEAAAVAAAVRAPVEAVEDARALGRRNARAGIVDAQQHAVAFAPDPDVDARTGRRI